MAKTRFPADRGLSARMLTTAFLLGLLYAVFVAALLAAHVQLGIVIVLAGGIGFVQYFFSDKIALYSMSGKIVTREQQPALHGVVDRLVAMANMPKPAVAVAQSDMPNALRDGTRPETRGRVRDDGAAATPERARNRGRALPRALPRGAP